MNFFTKFQGGAVAAVQHPTRRPWYKCLKLFKTKARKILLLLISSFRLYKARLLFNFEISTFLLY